MEYIADVGQLSGHVGSDAPRRDAIVAGMQAIRRHETSLFERLAAGLSAMPGVHQYGITDPARFAERTPTAAITADGVSVATLSRMLGDEGIATWHGDFYATGLIERLGLAESGGLLRIGLMHYNTTEEVDRLLEALERHVVADRPRPADRPYPAPQPA